MRRDHVGRQELQGFFGVVFDQILHGLVVRKRFVRGHVEEANK
jgi:hypothetical protein